MCKFIGFCLKSDFFAYKFVEYDNCVVILQSKKINRVKRYFEKETILLTNTIMNSRLISAFLGAALTLGLVACSENEAPKSGSGKIDPGFATDYNVESSYAMTRSAEEQATVKPDISEFVVHLSRKDGAYDKTFSSLAQFPTTQGFAIGDYTLEAYYGSLSEEGFDKPYYYGKCDFKVNDGETAKPEVTCVLANTMVSVEYTDAFKAYFSDYTTTIHSNSGGYVHFAANETRVAYVKPGTISISMALTKAATGEVINFVPTSISDAKARTHYTIKCDFNQGGVGDAVLSISFDDETVEKPVEVDLSEEFINAPAPTVAAIGFEEGTPVEIFEGDTYENPLKIQLSAMAGFGNVTLTTSSAYLISEGWPAEVDLMNMTDAQRAKLEGRGLKITGLDGKSRMALVDFAGVAPYMRPLNGQSDHSFTISVKDAYSKVSDPITLSVHTTPVVLALSNFGSMALGDKELSFDVAFVGNNIEDVAYEVKNADMVWETCQTVKIQEGNSNSDVKNYRVTIKIADPQSQIILRANYKKNVKKSDEITVAGPPILSLAVTEGDVWAKKAVLKVNCTDAQALASAFSSLNLYVSQNGGAYAAATATKDAATNTFTITGLNPGTSYKAKVSANTEANASKEVSFTTEVTTALPNGDFENVAQTIVRTIQCGGRYRETYVGQWKTHNVDYNVSEPSGWATVNAKTCNLSAANLNSWFVLPSTNTTSDAQSGTHAMQLTNVAWDNNGTTPVDDTITWGTLESELFCRNEPSSIAYRAAGKLFLGTYSFNASSLAETYNEGVNFASRPTSLSGYYKYTRDSQDENETGLVTITLLNGNTVIGSGTANLSAAGSYTAFSVPITYTVTNKKATTLKVMIASSNHASYDKAQETSSIKTSDKHQSKTEACLLGAKLVVDNLSLNY